MDNDLIELAARRNDGIEVRLLWKRHTRVVVLEVSDDASGRTREMQVPDGRALEAFEHPFSYIHSADPLADAAVV
jgi:hypothetical protein